MENHIHSKIENVLAGVVFRGMATTKSGVIIIDKVKGKVYEVSVMIMTLRYVTTK